MTTTETALLFSTKRNVVHAHKADCNALNRANGKTLIKVSGDEREDLTERGYKIVDCKCLKAKG